jgi:SynChlorMet cassette protein ScmC
MNELSQRIAHKSCFDLRLTNGIEWRLIACDASVAPWVRKLASVLHLHVSHTNGFPSIMFFREKNSSGPPSLQSLTRIMDDASDLPMRGWKEQRLGIVRFLRHPESQDIICGVTGDLAWDIQVIQMWTALSPVFDAAQDSGGLLFHAALAELNGSGALIIGPSGAGKSTCSRRLPVPWRSLCDDEVLIVRDSPGQYHAHPFPTWQELIRGDRNRSWEVQEHVRLKAIFFLKRSDMDEVHPISHAQAALWIYKSIQQTRERNDFSLTKAEEKALSLKLFGNACALAGSVPCFILDVTLSGRFWEEMQNVL